MNGFIRFNGRIALHSVKLTIGDDLTVWVGSGCNPNCRFIKVTRKGFNIVNLDTNRCILRKPIYAKGWAHKEFPARGPITGTFWIPDYIKVVRKEKPVDKVG